jgi:Mn-containing catalase
MQQLRELLVDSLQDLMHAETQLVKALPEMAEAAHYPKLARATDEALAADGSGCRASTLCL